MKEAIDRCLEEMYQKSQPKGSYLEYVKFAQEGLITKDDLVFERHYLCKNQFEYILNKYKKSYGFENQWIRNIDFLVDNLKQGGYKTVYKPLHEGGDPARTAEKIPPIDQIIGKENAEKLFKYIEDVKNFYRFDRNEEIFTANIALGASPTSNANIVKEYWKSKGKDIEIDETELSQDEYWEIDEYGECLREY